MTNDQTQGSLALVGILAAGVGLVAFGIGLVVGGWDYTPAAGVGIAVAAAVAVFLFIALHSPDRSGPGMAAHPAASAAPASGPETASETAPETAPAAASVPASAPVAAPAPAAAVMSAPSAVGRKPEGLSAPRGGKADDLKIIKGIGPKLEELCHALGYYHFDQIAVWTAEEIAWVDENLEGFRGRVTRDDWVGQARILARGGSV